MHVHLVHAFESQTDESGRTRRQGLKRECDAFAVVDAKRFLEQGRLDGEPVLMFENSNGVVLTAGARGVQEDGSDVPRACIPPGCIVEIRMKRSGDPIPTN